VAKLEASASAYVLIDREVLNTRNFTALVQGSPGNLHLTTSSSNSKEENFNFDVRGDLSSVLKVGPQISFMVYGAVGPYIDVPIKAEANLCAAGNPFEEFHWQAHAGLGIEGNLGARGKFFGKTLFDFSFNIFDCPLGPQIIVPNELEIMSGNYQTGTVGEELPNPVVVKVKSNLGFAVPFVQVRVDLEEGNGLTDCMYYWTDVNGQVSIDWELGNNPLNVMKISSGDCDFADIEGSPLYVYANSEIPENNCQNSSLQLYTILVGDQYICTATGGESPYLYSVDGSTYSTDNPVFSIYTPGEFTVYAKDAIGCQATHSFVIEPYNPCISLGLTAFAYVEENTVEITGTGGILPYTYALDDPQTFGDENQYSFLSEGPHVAYVRCFIQDTIACIDSAEFEIPEGAISPLLPIYPEEGQYYIPVADINFEWEAGNFAPDQIYDLYLDFGDGMGLIASDIETEDYFHAGPIPYYNQACSWRIVVKDQAGNVKDEATFSFTTGKENPGVPEPATLIFPENGIYIDTLSVDLQWIDQPGDFVYDVYFDNTDAETLIAMNVTDPPFIVMNLENNSMYYWKIVTKSIETGVTAVSDVFSFRPDTITTVTDFEGNIYHTLVIGGQKWIRENLKTTHFANGDEIPDGTGAGNISGETDPLYWFTYNDNLNNVIEYGRLYTWYTVVDDRNVCPDGWHVPTLTEWSILREYLGGYLVAGGKLKESGTLHWLTPNTGATNETGFTALPGGIRPSDGTFSGMTTIGRYWSATESNPTSATWVEMFNNSNLLQIASYSDSKKYGTTVRCVKD
jgi:uncharacterized protein (TIGR02145 family)